MIANSGQKRVDQTDAHVGSRIRLRRSFVGMTQAKLGEKVGVSFQQIQKYEKGANRIGAGRLQVIASALGVSVPFFFKNLPDPAASGEADDAPLHPISLEISQLNRAFLKVSSGRARSRIVALVRSISEREGSQ